MPNAWVNHVKQYAKDHNLKYGDALKDAECSASYKSGSGFVGMTRNGMARPAKQPAIKGMTRYGMPGTFTQEDARRIDQEDKERKAMKNTINSVTY
jgi:hypothetical protein